jgi:hypothetical protein
VVRKKLEAILKHKRVPRSEQLAYLDRVDRNHAALCAGEAWRKEDGQYAKGLEGWLSPTKERYEITPEPSAEPYAQPSGLKSIDQLRAERDQRRLEGGFTSVQSA